MKTTVVQQAPPLIRLACWQLSLTALLSLGSIYFRQEGLTAGLSALLGGLLALIVLQYIAWKADLRGEPTESPERLLLGFYRIAIGQFLLLATAFALLFRFGDSLDKLTLLLVFSVVSVFGAVFSAVIFSADRER